MRRSLNVIFCILTSAFIPSLSAFCQETFTLTTYYPAPFGVYNELRARRMAIGDDYFQQSAYHWGLAAGGQEIAADADLIVEGNVGIGTAVPVFPLDIQSAAGRDAWLKIGTTDIDNATSDAGIIFYEGPHDTAQAAQPNKKWAIFNKAESETYPNWDRLLFAVGPSTDYRMALVNNGNDFRVGIGAGTSTNTIPQTTLDVAGGVKVASVADGACSSTVSGDEGIVRFNTSTKILQYCNGTSWKNASGGAPTYGTYKGKGPAAADQKVVVNLGFRPKAVVIFGFYAVFKTDDMPAGDTQMLSFNSSDFWWLSGNVYITDTGFEIPQYNVYTNYLSTSTYAYLAW